MPNQSHEEKRQSAQRRETMAQQTNRSRQDYSAEILRKSKWLYLGRRPGNKVAWQSHILLRRRKARLILQRKFRSIRETLKLFRRCSGGNLSDPLRLEGVFLNRGNHAPRVARCGRGAVSAGYGSFKHPASALGVAHELKASPYQKKLFDEISHYSQSIEEFSKVPKELADTVKQEGYKEVVKYYFMMKTGARSRRELRQERVAPAGK